ncbi:Rad4-domain-containing protein [Pilatotrama ljubarskyi]|nr:Rad4-domain-containing protein [Pilatotrama ljubarskyi]
MNTENSSQLGEESEDDFDWEEVEVSAPALTLDSAQLQAETAAGLKEYYGESQEAEPGPSEKANIEITIQTKGKQKGDPKKNARAVQLAADRLVRLDCHKIHTVALLMNAKVRNHWLNDPLLQARLLSLTPLPLQNAFAMIHKSRVPEAAKRGRLFESAITRLADWWASTFEIVPTGHIRSRTFEEVQKTIRLTPPGPQRSDPKGKGKARAVEDDDDEDDEERYGIEGERMRSVKSLMKHALMRRGSRDTSAQLFTALCRALGIPARLVVSLQSVPWQAGVGKPKPTGKKRAKPPQENGDVKGKGRAKATGGDDEDDDDMEEVSIPGSSAVSTPRGRSPFPVGGKRLDGSSPATSGRDKAKKKAPPVIRLRKSRGQKLGSAATSEAERPRPRERTPDPTTTAPVFWTEVFSRADARWLPVDPVRVIVNRRKAFDPTPNPNAPASAKPDRRRPVRVENRMVYVLAFEEDGYARDVTPRYAREYGAKVAKVQQGGKGRREWWERICNMVKRPYRLQRDDLEDEELQANQMTEGMPTSMAGFKDHPLYVLERHLKRDEVVDPPTELGKFRGEPVYPRANVLTLKTAENWMRQGRKVREGAQPLKWVKQRAVTVNKKRAIELVLADQRERAASASSSSKKKAAAGDTGEDGAEGEELELSWDAGGGGTPGEGFASEEGVMQGLYAEHQTELYRPDPVVDGKVPKNDFGNIDLYVPSMLPAGAAHVPYKGTAKLARQLGFDYAEAVTGFEFKKRRAFPVITGVVVAAENEAALLEAYWEAEQDAEAKRRAKRQEQVIKRWTKLVQGLRIRQRLLEQYADCADDASGAQGGAAAANKDKDGDPIEEDPEKHAAGGGFLTGVDDVVQPYTLPRNLHEIVAHAGTSRSALGELKKADDPDGADLDIIERARQQEEEEEAEEHVLRGDKLQVIDGEGEHDDDDMEDVVVAPQLNGAPKTMQELAEEAARRNDTAKDGSANAVEELAFAAPATPPVGEQKPANGSRSTRTSKAASKSGTSTPRNGAATREKGRGNARGGKAASASSSSTLKPRRTRKRTRAEAEDSEASSSEDGRGEASEVDALPTPSPAKRARAKKPPPPVPPSTRVLRTRGQKSASKIQEERETEEAYRRAVAE